jgi:hypothetical protein
MRFDSCQKAYSWIVRSKIVYNIPFHCIQNPPNLIIYGYTICLRLPVHVLQKAKYFIFLGLATIANGLDLSLLAPRKKINVLLIGNHSAGKSSFVNW